VGNQNQRVQGGDWCHLGEMPDAHFDLAGSQTFGTPLSMHEPMKLVPP
jgi:hypothetical protein